MVVPARRAVRDRTETQPEKSDCGEKRKNDRKWPKEEGHLRRKKGKRRRMDAACLHAGNKITFLRTKTEVSAGEVETKGGGESVSPQKMIPYKDIPWANRAIRAVTQHAPAETINRKKEKKGGGGGPPIGEKRRNKICEKVRHDKTEMFTAPGGPSAKAGSRGVSEKENRRGKKKRTRVVESQ